MTTTGASATTPAADGAVAPATRQHRGGSHSKARRVDPRPAPRAGAARPTPLSIIGTITAYLDPAIGRLDSFRLVPPQACIRGLRDVAEAGAQLILLTPFFDEAEQMERLAAEVMPHVA